MGTLTGKRSRVTKSGIMSLFMERFCSYFQSANGDKMPCSHYADSVIVKINWRKNVYESLL